MGGLINLLALKPAVLFNMIIADLSHGSKLGIGKNSFIIISCGSTGQGLRIALDVRQHAKGNNCTEGSLYLKHSRRVYKFRLPHLRTAISSDSALLSLSAAVSCTTRPAFSFIISSFSLLARRSPALWSSPSRCTWASCSLRDCFCRFTCIGQKSRARWNKHRDLAQRCRMLDDL